MNILISIEEKPFAESLKLYFNEKGNSSLIVSEGENVLYLLSQLHFDVIFLDLVIGKLNGIEICKTLRAKKINTPVIFLTRSNDIKNKIEALTNGADDYLTYPLSFDELCARIVAVTRRYNQTTNIIIYDNLELDLLMKRVKTTSNILIKLTEKEFDLLKVLIFNKGNLISKDEICPQVWELLNHHHSNFCEATIKNLRKKLLKATGKQYIKTIYGKGYILTTD